MNGNLDVNGIQQFTVGAGGRSLHPLAKKPRPANPLKVQNEAFGVLSMTLREGSYDFEWVGLPMDPSFDDEGSFARR